MKRFIAPLLSMVLLTLAAAKVVKAESAVLHQGTAHDALYDIAFDGSFGLAAGDNGVVLESRDGGRSWAPDTPPDTELALFGVALRGERRFLVGQSGQIFRYRDGRWAALESGTQERLFQVGLGDSGLVVAVGGFGTIRISQDDGDSWTSPEFDWMKILNDYVEPHFYTVRVRGDAVTIGGEFGLVLRSADRGTTWEIVHRGEESVFDIALDEKGQGFAVGQKGLLLRTSDEGRSWQALDRLGDTNLLGIWQSGLQLFVTGIRGAYASHDGGRSWKPVTGSDLETGWYQAVASSTTRDKPELVGHRGRILEMDE